MNKKSPHNAKLAALLTKEDKRNIAIIGVLIDAHKDGYDKKELDGGKYLNMMISIMEKQARDIAAGILKEAYPNATIEIKDGVTVSFDMDNKHIVIAPRKDA